MLTLAEANDIDSIILILRGQYTLGIIHSVAILQNQIKAGGITMEDSFFSSILKMNPEFKNVRNIEVKLRRLGRDKIIVAPRIQEGLTPKGQKLAAFIVVAHKSDLLWYFMNIELPKYSRETLKDAAKILVFVQNFTDEKKYPPQKLADIRIGLSDKSISYRVNLLMELGFLKFEKPLLDIFKGSRAIVLTPKGKTLIEELEKAYRAYQNA